MAIRAVASGSPQKGFCREIRLVFRQRPFEDLSGLTTVKRIYLAIRGTSWPGRPVADLLCTWRPSPLQRTPQDEVFQGREGNADSWLQHQGDPRRISIEIEQPTLP